MRDSKYIVFKREEYFDALDRPVANSLHLRAKLNEIEIEDAVVIRLQDIFSSTALQSYFDAVSNTLEVLDDINARQDITIIRELETLRDWAFNITQEAREYKGKKIPDPQ